MACDGELALEEPVELCVEEWPQPAVTRHAATMTTRATDPHDRWARPEALTNRAPWHASR